MSIVKHTILSILVILIYSGCQPKGSPDKNEPKILHLADLANTSYKISDTTLTFTENSQPIRINFTILDSGSTEGLNHKIYTIGIESFSEQTPQPIKEIAALAIGKKIRASEIRILKDRATYEARITSDLSAKGGGEIMKLLEESWEFHFILK